ncbi:MAG: class II fructose-bisphosphate aldolase [Thermodesulfobacteriota bacterium]
MMNTMFFESIFPFLAKVIRLDPSKGPVIEDHKRLRDEAIDALIQAAVFGKPAQQGPAQYLIWELGQICGIYPASIHGFYMAIGRGEIDRSLTVPAINLRALTYDCARAAFQAAVQQKVGAVIFEIARSEIGYTAQRPREYFSSLMAAAIKEGFQGPLFIQGDHFQVSEKKFKTKAEEESLAIEELILEAVQAGFYNIDIDTSTLVDLNQSTVSEQQRANYEMCARFTTFIRKHQPQGITISVGGEIGEVGGKNSDEIELRAFVDGFNRSLASGITGLSKISIQTGTSHGGVVLPDGTLAQVAIDFQVLKDLSRVARKSYGLGGTVQHGASTLPDEAFHQFVANEAVEVHLATGFQNMIYDHPQFPQSLREEIYQYLKSKHADEWKTGKTEEQFLYSTRKKGLGPFKNELWGLPDSVRSAIRDDLRKKFAFYFEQLKVEDTQDLVRRIVPPVEVKKEPADFDLNKGQSEDVSDLAD